MYQRNPIETAVCEKKFSCFLVLAAEGTSVLLFQRETAAKERYPLSDARVHACVFAGEQRSRSFLG